MGIGKTFEKGIYRGRTPETLVIDGKLNFDAEPPGPGVPVTLIIELDNRKDS